MRCLGFAVLTAPERLREADYVFAEMSELPGLLSRT
jgi:hypothetical protein